MDKQVWVGAEIPKPEKVNPIKHTEDSPPKKPQGGLWTSTLKTTEGGEISSGWIEWMKSEKYCNVQEPEAWILEPKDDIDVYVIDSVEDAMEIMIPIERNEEMSMNEYRIDWAEVFGIRGYDAIRLTHEGQIATRFPDKKYTEEGRVKTGYDRGYNLYGWDAESVLSKEWIFTDREYAGKITIPKVTY